MTFLGHTFADEIGMTAKCHCGVSYITALTEGKPHVGSMNEAETKQRAEQLARIWEAVEEAVRG